MAGGAYTQTVPQALLEKKVGRKLQLREEFTTPTGCWRVVALCGDGKDSYTVEKIG